MNTIEKRQYEMLVRVRDFGTAHADRFPKSTLGNKALADVNAAVDALNQHGAEWFSSRPEVRGGSIRNTTACQSLVAMVDTISRTAKAVALDTPGVEERFRVIAKKNRVAILNAARGFARDVEPIADQFVAHGMPKDFVKQLMAKITGFEQALRDREAGKERHASARASTKATLESGLAAVQRLGAIVHNVIGDDDAAMAAWAVARRMERFRGPARGASSPTDSPPPAATIAGEATTQPATPAIAPQPVGA